MGPPLDPAPEVHGIIRTLIINTVVAVVVVVVVVVLVAVIVYCVLLCVVVEYNTFYIIIMVGAGVPRRG